MGFKIDGQNRNYSVTGLKQLAPGIDYAPYIIIHFRWVKDHNVKSENIIQQE